MGGGDKADRGEPPGEELHQAGYVVHALQLDSAFESSRVGVTAGGQPAVGQQEQRRQRAGAGDQGLGGHSEQEVALGHGQLAHRLGEHETR